MIRQERVDFAPSAAPESSQTQDKVHAFHAPLAGLGLVEAATLVGLDSNQMTRELHVRRAQTDKQERKVDARLVRQAHTRSLIAQSARRALQLATHTCLRQAMRAYSAVRAVSRMLR